ncbi:hypothetical protein CWD94_11665 [Lysinibacillus xylanilyticus]|uniref:Uncharacterized protein n=1 Tax=Lysinibacillus xylanilyticus TaxID=582475 RepID=A0A2M9Q606_9BACI|nr:hypothetical protein CWD94_11665 [Lysinibacillus xylanilyticus]
MSRFATLQGLICDADPQGVAQPPLQSTSSHRMYLLASFYLIVIQRHFSICFVSAKAKLEVAKKWLDITEVISFKAIQL